MNHQFEYVRKYIEIYFPILENNEWFDLSSIAFIIKRIRGKNAMLSNILSILPNFVRIIKLLEYWWGIKYPRYIKFNRRTGSTWQLPSHINSIKFNAKIQKASVYKGLYAHPFILLVSTKGSANKIKIATNILITPNNLFGILRKIA